MYADWLQGQGHPRGQLGVLQAQRAERPDDAGLAKAEHKLFEAHPTLAPSRVLEAAKRTRKTGEPEERTTIGWENGFIASGRITKTSDKPPYTVRELVGELLAHPAARFLRELRIGSLGEDVHDYADVIEEIIRGCPSTLRVLSLVDLPPGSAALVFADLADVTPLLAATPLLEELRLAGSKVELAALALASLKRLAIATSDPKVLATLASAKLPALESIQLSSGGEPLLASALAKVLSPTWRVAQLAITRTANTDELVPHILRSPLLSELRTLDLSGGKLSDRGAEFLVAGRAKLAHLEHLDLSGNTLTQTAHLATLCTSVRFANQRVASAATISEADLRRMSPDAAALAKGREVAKPKLWPALGRDDTTYWGTCQGSDTYEVWLRVPSLDNGCSCPSGKRPCKHTIALAILIADGHPIESRALPSGLLNRAGSARYYGGGE